jgi:hypothetical protein
MRKVPLKHRKAGEVEDLPDGPVCDGTKAGAMYATIAARMVIGARDNRQVRKGVFVGE